LAAFYLHHPLSGFPDIVTSSPILKRDSRSPFVESDLLMAPEGKTFICVAALQRSSHFFHSRFRSGTRDSEAA
jgi:hypothetical protein